MKMSISKIYLKLSACVLFIALSAAPSEAQRREKTPKKSLEIAAMVNEIKPSNIEQTIRSLAGFGTRNTLSSQDNPKRGIGAARDWIYNEFKKISEATGGRLIVEKQTFLQPAAARVPKPTILTNIVATLPGDLPEAQNRRLIVSGHYDSMCASPTDAEHDAPGANDDASGCAAVLEIARAMSNRRFRATLVFVCVAGEEQGLLGSGYLAEQAKLKNWNIEAMFTNDIIGSSTGGNGVHDAKTVRVFSEGIPTTETEAEAKTRKSIGGEEDSPSRQLARYIKEAGEKHVKGMKVTLISRRDRYLRGGDHIPFNENGYPAVRFTEPNEDYRHQHQNLHRVDGTAYGDLPEFTDPEYIAKVAKINLAALASLALAPAPPKDSFILTKNLTTDTNLEWTAVAEEGVAGYEVVWRETSEPLWTHSRFVGNVNAYTVAGLSKDNFLFGIRAVGRTGGKSPVRYPRPLR